MPQIPHHAVDVLDAPQGSSKHQTIESRCRPLYQRSEFLDKLVHGVALLCDVCSENKHLTGAATPFSFGCGYAALCPSVAKLFLRTETDSSPSQRTALPSS